MARAVLILDGEGQIASLLPVQRHAAGVPAKLHHVAGPADPQPVGGDAHTADDQQIAPPLPGRGVVGLPVEGFPLHRPDVLRPLIFNMDQRPLAAAEAKMLQPGELEVVILGKHLSILHLLF